MAEKKIEQKNREFELSDGLVDCQSSVVSAAVVFARVKKIVSRKYFGGESCDVIGFVF